MTSEIKTFQDFVNVEKVIYEKTTEYINRVGWAKAQEVLVEALEGFEEAKGIIFEILENEDFEHWFQMGVELNSKKYDFYSVLGIEDIAKAIRLAYKNKDLMREVFQAKLEDYKESQKFLESLSA